MKKRLLMVALALIVALSVPAYSAHTVDDIDYDTVSNPDNLVRLLRDLFDQLRSTWIRLTPQTSAPTAQEGKIYYDDTANALYFSADGSTWTQLSSGSGNALDGAYNLGSKIEVDGDNLELEVDDGSNNSALLIDHDEATNDNAAVVITNAADAAGAVSIQIDGTAGYDLQGTGDTWEISIAGLLTTSGGFTIEAGDCLFDDTYDVSWDTSRDQLLFEDNAVLGIGGAHDAAGDVTMTFDASDFLLDAATADEGFKIGDTTTGFDITYYWETSGTITTDYDGDVLTFDGGDLVMNDDDIIEFGDSKEFSVYYDETTTDNLIVSPLNASDAFQVGDGTTVADVIFQSTGDAAAQVQFDGSGDTNNGQMLFGADDHGIDVVFYGATASQKAWWDQSGDTWYFGADAEGVDVYFYADTTADLFLWDESDEALEGTGVQLHLDDDSILQIGTGKDFGIYSDTANKLEFDPATAGAEIRLGTANTDAVDVLWYSDTSGDFVFFDEEDADVNFVDVDLMLDDNADLVFGSNSDFTIDSDTAETLDILATVDADDDSVLNIGADQDGIDLNLFAATASDGISFDASAETFTITGVDVVGTGDEALGGFKKTVTVDIDDRVMTAAESGHVFTNGADANTSVFTLPTAAAGLIFTFVDVEAGAGADLCILANTGDKIQNGDAAAYYNCYDDTYGSTVTLVAVDATEWVVIATNGTWTADSDTTAP